MEYKIEEDELFDIIRAAYLRGMHGKDTANSVADEAIRKLRPRIVDDTHPPTPPGYHWEEFVPLGDMMSAGDCETYVQEMGVPPPMIIGPGPIGPDTLWRDINGVFYRR